MSDARDYIDESAVAALAALKISDTARSALEYIRRYLNPPASSHRDSAVERAVTDLMLAIYERKQRDLNRATLFGIVLDPQGAQREAVLKQVTRFIARQNASIMQYLEIDGEAPGRYLDRERQDFRDQLDKALTEVLPSPGPGWDVLELVEGAVWCPYHGEVHANSTDPYDEGTECGEHSPVYVDFGRIE